MNGDIIKVKDNNNKTIIGEVVYDSEYCEYRAINKDEDGEYYIPLWKCTEPIIIGNIYENPELLKKEEG